MLAAGAAYVGPYVASLQPQSGTARAPSRNSSVVATLPLLPAGNKPLAMARVTGCLAEKRLQR